MSHLPPGSVQISPIPFDGSTPLVNRVGGTLPLPVRETDPGVFVSAWVINKSAMKKLKQHGACLTLVVDTNVPGHPSVSMVVQVAELTK